MKNARMYVCVYEVWFKVCDVSFYYSSPVAMRITIRSVGGFHFSLDVPADASYDELRVMIATGIAPGPDVYLSLVLGERALPHTSGLALADLGLEDGAALTVIKRLAPRLLTADISPQRAFVAHCNASALKKK